MGRLYICMWLLIVIIRIKKFKIYYIYVFLYFIYLYICVYDIVFWYLFFYRGMYDFLDYEGDDVEDVFCLIFEVSLNKFGYTR